MCPSHPKWKNQTIPDGCLLRYWTAAWTSVISSTPPQIRGEDIDILLRPQGISYSSSESDNYQMQSHRINSIHPLPVPTSPPPNLHHLKISIQKNHPQPPKTIPPNQKKENLPRSSSPSPPHQKAQCIKLVQIYSPHPQNPNLTIPPKTISESSETRSRHQDLP